MNKIESLFLSNGYPRKIIQKTKFTVKTHNKKCNQAQQQPLSQKTFICLPYIDDSLSRKIECTVKSSKLPIKIAWQSGQTLSEKLTTSALQKPPCPAGNKKCHCCMSGLDGRCHTKNAVYMITCELCTHKPTYIGESKRSVRLRYNEHLRDAKNQTKNTPFGEHFMRCHPDTKIDEKSLSIKILQICKDVAELKIAESIEIRNRKPKLNIMFSSWSLIKPVPYSEL